MNFTTKTVNIFVPNALHLPTKVPSQLAPSEPWRRAAEPTKAKIYKKWDAAQS